MLTTSIVDQNYAGKIVVRASADGKPSIIAKLQSSNGVIDFDGIHYTMMTLFCDHYGLKSSDYKVADKSQNSRRTWTSQS